MPKVLAGPRPNHLPKMNPLDPSIMLVESHSHTSKTHFEKFGSHVYPGRCAPRIPGGETHSPLSLVLRSKRRGASVCLDSLGFIAGQFSTSIRKHGFTSCPRRRKVRRRRSIEIGTSPSQRA